MRNKNESAAAKTTADKQKGFTLIELLVVIAIIGLLASVVLLALNSARAKSRDAKRLADVRQIASALELAYNDLSTYPVSLAALVPKYIGIVPVAPTPADSNGTNTCDATENTYTYAAGGAVAGATYTLTFCLGDNTGGYQSGNRVLSEAGIK